MPPKKRITPPMNDIMIDLETLATTADAAILSIGACRFNADEIDDEGFYRVITIDSNQRMHRRISPSTLVWWLGQTDKAKAVFTDPAATTIHAALADLSTYLGPNSGNLRVWGNGADFDISILAHAYAEEGRTPPWNFYNVRCFRTIKEQPKAKSVPKPANLGAHNALFDAIAQAQHLQAIWKATA